MKDDKILGRTTAGMDLSPDHAEAQKAICKRFGSDLIAVGAREIAGVALQTLEQSPIFGAREKREGETSGWYIWAGPYSTSPDFFQPVHVNHLVDLLPAVVPYLGLSPGFQFIIDRGGYEDVWQEELGPPNP